MTAFKGSETKAGYDSLQRWQVTETHSKSNADLQERHAS